ncbi:HNH endonuclease [Modestobacter sp. VKM Ac-2978]|uniref:HNH endonuclease n=1 Tax=Modestobacter sp. VKM Ac-2978 TaxID=3004132 RepID=UPI0022AB1257|nr:HNH endonuclease [Modestobacter sp. VKM Ac-2978]MCZ2847420.1 HNH endonuclease [Modestobacter sp. VKM Ac-2978]
MPRKYLQRRGERFWPYVDQSAGHESCWPWHGAQRFDSGTGKRTGVVSPSRRIGWRGPLSSGLDIPYDLVVDHRCCCTWCQNPDHLEPITRAENNRRRYQRPAEATRLRTSFDSPFEDRWYPFGRRLYDEAGNRLPDVEGRALDGLST